MDLTHLRSFAVLAEELHFGRAADRLGMTQSALSQQLQKLETVLEVQLLVRTSREVALTEAGTELLEPALGALAAASRAYESVVDIKAGRAGRLRLGSVSAGMNGMLPQILERYRDRMPTSIIEVHGSDSRSQERALVAWELDAIIVRRLVDHRLIATIPLTEERLVVFLPEGHRLADRPGAWLEELKDEDFVFWQREPVTTFHDSVLEVCRAHGFEPNIKAYGATLEAHLALVASGGMISLQSDMNSSISRRGVRMVPILDDDARFTLRLAYLATKQTAALSAFLTCVQEALHHAPVPP